MAKRNEQDLTLRNLRAQKKQLAELARRVRRIETVIARMPSRVTGIRSQRG